MDYTKTGDAIFKLRAGKRLEFCFYAVFCLALSAFPIFVVVTGTNGTLNSGSLFFIVLGAIPIIAAFIFLLTIFRANLVKIIRSYAPQLLETTKIVP